MVARPQCWGVAAGKEPMLDSSEGGRHAARSVAKGYFLHPQKGAGRGVPKRNTLLLSGCLDSGHRSCWLRQRTRAAEVLTYADVWATMETAGAGGRELGRRFTDSAGSRRQEQARGQNAKLRSQGREQPRMDSTGGRQGAEDSRSSRPDERAGQQAGSRSGRHDFPLSSAQIHLSGAGYGTNGNQ